MPRFSTEVEACELVGQEVEIDDTLFRNCTFDHCALVYRGGSFAFTNCEFIRPGFLIDDTGFEGIDPHRRESLEQIFRAIQKSTGGIDAAIGS